ncbi:MAG: adenylyltransferase/cytidyltransferase family protein [Nitrospirae bacterium]|nr:adenylyltransferase/cytidyltransferase family protein [Nitrospirota bacterium]
MNNKCLPIDELIITINRLKGLGKKIVFTNGCFDIIHAGHVRCLKEARSHGDILIIGVNSDSSVSAIKKGRPIINQEYRVEVLTAFEMVDYITVFDQSTPAELIKKIRPDVIAKGGDWHREDIVGGDIAKEVYSLPYYDGLSTTNIIDVIINKYLGKFES